MLAVGSKVIYPSQGPCHICCVVRRVFNGTPVEFYHLVILADNGGELYIPVDKTQAVGVRPLLEKHEIPKLLEQLKSTAGTADNWRQRAVGISKLFASGSAFDLAEVVESLTELSETKALSPRESQTLDKAKRPLVCEIAEVLQEPREEAERQVDEALQTAAGRRETCPRE